MYQGLQSGESRSNQLGLGTTPGSTNDFNLLSQLRRNQAAGMYGIGSSRISPDDFNLLSQLRRNEAATMYANVSPSSSSTTN